MENEKQKLPPLPELARFGCGGCGRVTVNQKGSKLLCDHCVNQFLADNVGVMDEQAPEDLVE